MRFALRLANLKRPSAIQPEENDLLSLVIAAGACGEHQMLQYVLNQYFPCGTDRLAILCSYIVNRYLKQPVLYQTALDFVSLNRDEDVVKTVFLNVSWSHFLGERRSQDFFRRMMLIPTWGPEAMDCSRYSINMQTMPMVEMVIPIDP